MITTLDKICVLGGGAGFPDKYQGSKEGYYPFIKVSDMNLVGNERCITHANNYLDEVDRQALGAKVFSKGATVFAKVGAALNLNRRRMLVGETLIDNNMMAAMPIVERVLPEYLFYCLSRIDLGQISQVGSVPSVNQEQVGSLRVFCPEEIKEQQKIVEILSDCDTAIEQAQNRYRIFQQELAGLTKSIFSKEQTSSWKSTTLEHLGRIASGGTPSSTTPAYWDGDVAWATPTDITNLSGRYISATEKYITQAGVNDSSAEILPKGSLLVCTRATVGDCAINTVPMATNQGFKSIIPKDDVDIDFLFYLVRSEKREILRRSAGSTFLEISGSGFSSLPVFVTNIEMQRQIGAMLRCAQEQSEQQKEAINLLKQQKRGLMQQLLTGKLRVKGAA